MEQFLPGLLRDLERRCSILRDRLAAIPAEPDVRDLALGAYQLVEGVRRDTAQLLADPSLGVAMLLPNHLQLYKRWNELVTLVESYPLPFVERYAEPDRRLTRLCRRLAEQVGWPLPSPVVAAFSSQYYWTAAGFSLICAPATAGTTLLGLPDLCHELGHILLLHHEAVLVGDFVQELTDYIEREQRRVDNQQRPPDYRRLYELLFVHWRDWWLREFISDMAATFVIGPAFGWQHVRLCVGGSRAAYHPSLGEMAEHPADEARLRGVLAVLDRMGAAEAGTRIRALWDRYLPVSQESPPAEYEVCYPQALMESLARGSIEGCRQLGLRGFNLDVAGHPNDLASVLSEAWERFIADPETYAEWERGQLEGLWQDIGFPPS